MNSPHTASTSEIKPSLIKDTEVDGYSIALKGRHIDLVVSGSIGAVESVRFVRALRRLGAQVQVYLTEGAKQFVTPLALEWASGRPVIHQFSGSASHVAENNICLICPGSASFLGKIANGLSDCPASALVASYLGRKKQSPDCIVAALPNMHDSLAQNPMFARNASVLTELGIHFFESRKQEGKQKFPEPQVLADEVAHICNRQHSGSKVVVAMGSMRGYIDDIRYISNYSSGELGSLVVEEFYRFGFETNVLNGPSEYKPHCFSKSVVADTFEDLLEHSKSEVKDAHGVVFLTAVLDFIPITKQSGKIPSSADVLHVELRKTEKIIDQLHPPGGIKVAFKLTSIDTGGALSASPTDYAAAVSPTAASYIANKKLSMLVANDFSSVSSTGHVAVSFEPKTDGGFHIEKLHGKQNIARKIVQHFRVNSGLVNSEKKS